MRTNEERIDRLEDLLKDLASKMGYQLVTVEIKTGIKDNPVLEKYRVAPLD